MTLTLLGPALMGVSCGDKVGASTDASKETDPGAVTQNWAIPRGGSSLQGRVPDAVLRKPRVKWDAVLDRFPEGTVDGLYLPDFGEMAAADTRHDEALDRRFDSLRNSEA